jgi:CrcB protein
MPNRFAGRSMRRMTPMDALCVGLGGGLGSVLRWWTGKLVDERYVGGFPLGTFVINVSGAFVIGYLSVLFEVDWHDRYGSILNAGVLTGLLGGYTTFSSMQLGAAELRARQRGRLAAFYLLLSTAAGLLAAMLGSSIARMHF